MFIGMGYYFVWQDEFMLYWIELTNMEIKEDKEENDNSNILGCYFY